MYEICEDTVNLPRRHLGPLVRDAVLLHDRGYGAPQATAIPLLPDPFILHTVRWSS
jgi:hypothetical protein